ncbi:ECF transporter S component [Sporolactobacillus sp. STCC-11]|uniref:ECF transporter S component n=1 Tax=Sporolactobacillus caesalpiniae TaxID=3230362 RepID=UPI003398E919
MLTIHKMTLLALLAAAAVAGRLAIHGVNIQPATLIIILTGWFFGWKMGAAEGLLTALVSDLFLGLGYWTLFHLVAWGLIGLLSALLPQKQWLYFLWLVVSGLLFGMIMALSYFVFTQNPLTVVGLWISGLPFDLYHAAGNLIFGLFSPLLFKVFASEARKLNKQTR